MSFGADNDGEGTDAHFEPADDSDITTVAEDNALLETLRAALATLTQEERDLIRDVFWLSKTERELAPQLGLKEPKSVNKRKKRVLEILKRNEALRSFFE
jgi:DNA-directed RNA polymerase specialized sigma24 family protein